MKIPADFDAEIWSVVAEIPAGRVATYGQLARLIGMPGHARRAGRALALAPEGLPCHRVVASNGRCAPHWPEQQMLLLQEGVSFLPGGKADLAHYRWSSGFFMIGFVRTER